MAVLSTKPRISVKELQELAKKNGYEPAAVYSVGMIEGSGDGFDDNGFPDILFERHVMYQLLLAKRGKAFADSQAAANPSIVNPIRTPTGGYGKASQQGLRLDAARKIDNECALQACSWGRFQVLGKWFSLLGYKTIQEFVNAMCDSEAKQFDAFLQYCKNVAPKAGKALKELDFKTFAIYYNGAGTSGYAPKMQAMYSTAVQQGVNGLAT